MKPPPLEDGNLNNMCKLALDCRNLRLDGALLVAVLTLPRLIPVATSQLQRSRVLRDTTTQGDWQQLARPDLDCNVLQQACSPSLPQKKPWMPVARSYFAAASGQIPTCRPPRCESECRVVLLPKSVMQGSVSVLGAWSASAQTRMVLASALWSSWPIGAKILFKICRPASTCAVVGAVGIGLLHNHRKLAASPLKSP